MRHLLAASLLSLCVVTHAQAAEPSPASIERLLLSLQAQKQNEAILSQVNSSMKSTFENALGTRDMTAEQRQQAQGLIDEIYGKMAPIFQEELAWSRLKGLTAQIYAETFTQEEIDGLITFYESPAGQAFVVKMPLVLQKSVLAMQQLLGPLMQKVNVAATQAAHQFKARQAAAGKP